MNEIDTSDHDPIAGLENEALSMSDKANPTSVTEIENIFSPITLTLPSEPQESQRLQGINDAFWDVRYLKVVVLTKNGPIITGGCALGILKLPKEIETRVDDWIKNFEQLDDESSIRVKFFPDI